MFNKMYLSLLLLVLFIPGDLLAACVSSISFNTDVADTWEADCDSEQRAGSFAKYYTFSLSSSQEVIIDLESSRDTYLYLLDGSDQDGAVIDEDDDSGPGNDSRIVKTLAAGTYTVEATTYTAATTGEFVVSVNAQQSSGACTQTISANTNVQDIWETDCSSEHRAMSYAKYYSFTLSSSQEVTIDLESSVDSYLYLLDGEGMDGAVIDEDDDGGAGDNSRIVQTLAAGTYTVEATTFTADTTGAFVVSVNVQQSSGVCTQTISSNANVKGNWVPECESTQRNDSYAKYYTFTLSSSQEVTIDLESSEDTFLYLLNGSGQDGAVIAEDDDRGPGDNSRIVKILSAGTYTIEATTFKPEITGAFVLIVNVKTSTCTDCPFEINIGLNDAWFDTTTSGQGFTITVYPELKRMFVAWFTFDTERPDEDVTAMLGAPGQRWLTAQGPYDGNTATLTIFVTEGGVFDSAQPPASTDQDGDGTLVIEFVDCLEALASYEITSLDISGEIVIERIVLDLVPFCELLADPK